VTKRERIEELRHTMWRNMPSFPTTCGPCCRCRTKSARGSGLCFDCARNELAELVGRKPAEEYAKAIKKIRELENKMDDPE
jgi:hypothetical protein